MTASFSARIYVVDDDPVVARLIGMMLKRMGHEVTTFNDGNAILQAVRERPPVLLLTDLSMNGMNGFQVLSAVKESAPQVGVIMVSASTELADAMRAIRNGATDYVTKPVQLENLQEVVSRALRLAQLEEQNRAYLEELRARDLKLSHELDLARTIQRELLPAQTPLMPGLDLAVKLIPSGDIGGDLYDFVHFREKDRLGILLTDISGHGVPAAMMSTMFKVVASEVLRRTDKPSEAFNEMHRRLSKVLPSGHFASSFYALFNMSDRTLKYVKASQESGLLFREGQPVQLLDRGGPLLGLFDPDLFGERPYPETALELRREDTLVLFTDGLVECKDEQGEAVMLDGLLQWLKEDISLPPGQLAERLHNRALVHTGQLELEDDMTIVVARIVT
ncbi:MAG: PP2C family protein-serine/threonine phosphatase [Candidatus Xenobia bacterium]